MFSELIKLNTCHAFSLNSHMKRYPHAAEQVLSAVLSGHQPLPAPDAIHPEDWLSIQTIRSRLNALIKPDG